MENAFKQPKLKLAYLRSSYSKTLGINLIGLMISSALGAFIAAVIIKVTVTVSNNYQLIKGMAELQKSARILDDLFGKFFSTNGFGINNTDVQINTFNINSANDTLNFSIWYAGSSVDNPNIGINDSISCSGRQLETTSGTQEIRITIRNMIGTNPGTLSCSSNFSNGSGINISDMPLMQSRQIVRSFTAAIIENPNQLNSIQIIPVNFAHAQPTTNPITFNSFGIKLAFILKSTAPVFNVDKTTEFNNIFGIADFNFSVTDKHLYKLVIIESPFFNRQNPVTTNYIQTRILQSS